MATRKEKKARRAERKAASPSPQPAKAKAKAQTQLNNRVQKIRSKARDAKKSGDTSRESGLRAKVAGKQLRGAKNQLATAQAAGNTERAGRLKNRIQNLKTKRNDRRQKSFNSQKNVNSASDFDFTKHSGKVVGVKELGHLRRNKGFSKADIADAANNSGLKIGKRAQQRLNKWSSAKDKANGTKQPDQPHVTQPAFPPTPTPTPDRPHVRQPAPPPTPTPTPTPTQPTPNPTIVTPQPTVKPIQPNPYVNDIDDSFNDFDDSFNNTNDQNTDYDQTQNNNYHDFQDFNVSGDDNYINAPVDASNRIYGGDVRTFNYQSNGYGSGGQGLDTPVSAATMAGFYAPSDSHGAIAARNDRRITQANDSAKDNMNTSHIAQGAMHMARNNLTIDPAKMDERIQGRAQASKAKAYMMGNSIYGDLAGFNPQWNQPQSPEKTQMPNFG